MAKVAGGGDHGVGVDSVADQQPELGLQLVGGEGLVH